MMNTSTAVATRQDQPPAQARPIDTVRAALERMKPQLAMALPRHLTPDRLLRVAITAIQNTPKLLECDRTSLYSAIMTCAQLGLEPDGVLGQAYLIPYGDKVQFIPGYRGLIALARNSGDVQSVIAHEVYANDIFGHWDERSGRHQLDLANPEPPVHRMDYQAVRGELQCFYAIARFKDGGTHWDVMSRPEVDAIRDASQGYRMAKRYAKDGKINSPWAQHYVEMGKKTVVRRIAKFLPMQVQKAAALADAYDTGRHGHITEHGEVVIASAPVEPGSAQIEAPKPNALDRFEAGDGGDGNDNANDGAVDAETAEASPAQPAPEPQDDARFLVDPPPAEKGRARDWKGWQDRLLEKLRAYPGDAAEIDRVNRPAMTALFKDDPVRFETVKAALLEGLTAAGADA